MPVRILGRESHVRILGRSELVGLDADSVRKRDPAVRARENLAQALRALGCREFGGDPRGEWWWVCSVCGYDVYVEVPKTWPFPEGKGKPSVLSLWLDERRIPPNFHNLRPDTKVINGVKCRRVCIVKMDPAASPENILTLFKFWLKEVGACR